MLVTFESKVGRITMMGDIAVQLLKMMGHSGTIPSALLAADIPEAVANLEQALAAAEAEAAPPAAEETGNGDKPAPVSLRTRAFPLIQLLKDAEKQSVEVLWEQGGSAPLKF